jgi:Glyoxalase/Bleomycin resistance protein/Dioxygenase superfamily
MPLFDFGQPVNGVVQMAYLVPNIEDAIGQWVDMFHAGPFFVTDRYAAEDAYYRGQPTDVVFKVAIGFSGHMQIELIEMLDDQPSVYREVFDRQGYGFHHFGIVTTNYDGDVDKLTSKGYELAFQGVLGGTTDRAAYLDSKGRLPGFIELIPASFIPRVFTPIYRASVGWSGKQPIRKVG